MSRKSKQVDYMQAHLANSLNNRLKHGNHAEKNGVVTLILCESFSLFVTGLVVFFFFC